MSINYKDALDIITSKISVISHTKEIPILDSVKHICAQNIYATTDLPKYPISLKDGFGILENDRYEVSTGDIVREGTIGVVPLEEIHLEKKVIKNQNIKEAAEDIKENELLLSQGDFIRAHSITSLVSQGFKAIRVFESPRVSILSIGDNLCPVEEAAKKGEVYNSNALSLAARVLEIGASVHQIKQCKNSIKDIISTLNELTGKSDFIVTTGAMSIHDAMSKAIYDDSFEILFHKVKIAPATPSALTYLNDTPMLHLPGLPLSAMLGFEILGIPTLKVIKNENLQSNKSIFVKNKNTFTCKESCTNAIPGHFDGHTFKSATSFGAGMLNVLAKCNGYALIGNKTNIKKDDLVEFLFF